MLATVVAFCDAADCQTIWEREEEMHAMEDSRVRSEWAEIRGLEIAGVVREIRSCSPWGRESWS
jgi:hypothetical protein